MKDVKQKHQQKLIEKKLKEEKRKEEEKYIAHIMEGKKYDWRKKLNEGMTSSGTFFTTLPATGDVNLETISTNTATNNGSSQGSGDFNIGGSYIQFDGEPSASGFRDSTFTVDTTKYTTVTFSAIAGNNINGGDTPTNSLDVYWISPSGGAGILGSIPKTTTSLTQFSFNIPPEARGESIDIVFVDEPGDNISIDDTFYVGKTISSHPSTIGVSASYWIYEVIRLHPTWNNNAEVLGATASFRTLLAWSHLQSTYIGQTSNNVLFPNWPTDDLNAGYPSPVSGYNSSVSIEDLQAIHSNIISTFGTDQDERRPITYGITDLNFQRRAPMNVFVPLDSPEASSFIRTDPMMSNLSPQERLKKLKEMLEASDEYVMKMLGLDFPGTGAVPPGEYDPFAQVPPGEAGDTPGVEIAGTANFPPVAPGYGFRGRYDQFGREIDPKTGNPVQSPMPPATKLKQADTGTQDTQIAQNWTDDPSTWPSIKNPVKSAPAIIDPKTGWPSVPNVPPSYKGKPGGIKLKLAHYEPEGELISEKKKLKSPDEVLNKIPGYYDGKPAPLGFPEIPPPKMVNGMHPDLVDGKKVADRFNRLDPESAKAMPPTGNPHIDKKVRAARKKPK